MKFCRIQALAAAAFATALGALPAPAHDFKVGDLAIGHPWARPNLPNRPTAAYMTISNTGTVADRLLAAESPAFGKVEMHTVIHQGDVMQMRPVETIEVPAEGAAELAPGGDHMMLFDARQTFSEGESFPLLLRFEQAGDVTVEVTVERKANAHGGHEGHGMTHGSGTN